MGLDHAAGARVAESGAPEGFGALYLSELPYVCNSLRRLGVAARDVEDLAHDVFVAAYGRADAFDSTRPMRPWLFGFAFRVTCAHRNRASTRREVFEKAPEVADQAKRADEVLADQEVQRKVLKTLDLLGIEQRAVFILHDIDCVPVPEIARTLRVPLNTAYSRLRAARQNFTAEFKRLDEGAGEP